VTVGTLTSTTHSNSGTFSNGGAFSNFGTFCNVGNAFFGSNLTVVGTTVVQNITVSNVETLVQSFSNQGTLSNAGAAVFGSTVSTRGLSNVGYMNVSTSNQAYPPSIAFTNNLMMITNQTYGNGLYIVSASTTSNTAYVTYDADTMGTYWQSAGYTYSNNGIYAGSVYTIDVSGTTHSGEWWQVQFPTCVIPKQGFFYCAANGGNYCIDGVVLASTDGLSWSNIYAYNSNSPNFLNSTQDLVNFTTSSSNAYNYYRLVIKKSGFFNSNNGLAQFGPAVNDLRITGPTAPFTVINNGQVGLGVTNPQQQLEVAGNAMFYGNISAGNMGMFRNYVINGAMQVNQRGITSTPSNVSGGVAYPADRFICFRSAYAAGLQMSYQSTTTSDLPFTKAGIQNYIRLQRQSGNTALDNIIFGTNLEALNTRSLAGNIVTLSFYYRTGSGFSAPTIYPMIPQNNTDTSIINGTYNSVNLATASPSTSWKYYQSSGLISTDTYQANIAFQFIPTGTAGASDYIDITGVQLEKGSIATPFELRPYPVELQLCQSIHWYYHHIAPRILGP